MSLGDLRKCQINKTKPHWNCPSGTNIPGEWWFRWPMARCRRRTQWQTSAVRWSSRHSPSHESVSTDLSTDTHEHPRGVTLHHVIRQQSAPSKTGQVANSQYSYTHKTVYDARQPSEWHRQSVMWTLRLLRTQQPFALDATHCDYSIPLVTK